MNQRFLKKLSRYCAIALICAMIAIPAAPSWGTSYAAPVPIAKATGPDSLALGDSAKSIGSFSAAIGYGAKTTGDYSIAIGKEAYALAEYSTAIGTFSDAFFSRSVALGYKSGATATDQVSIGTYKYDPTYDWIYTRTLVGLKSSIAGATGATFGDKLNTAAATDNGKYAAVNVQDLAEAIKGSGTGTNSYQAGVGAKATDDRATAIGVSAQATDDRTTAIGASAQATGFYSTASGYMAQATGGYSTAVGNSAQATKSGSAALGYNAKATGDRSAALGTGAQATGVDSTALGYNAKANIDNSTALGSNAQATGYYSTALGSSAQATNSSTAVGRNAKATGDYSTALGDNAEATERSATAIGRYAAATHLFGVALGYNSNTTAADQVSIGQYNSGWQTTRTIVGLKSSISTDAGADGKTFVQKLGDAAADDNGKYAAVNVSDLKSLADELGGGGGGGGKIYTEGKNIKLTDPDQSVINLDDNVKLAEEGSLSVGDKKYIDANGLNANDKKVTNVAAGTADSDAINYGQLKAQKEAAEKYADEKADGALTTAKKYTDDSIAPVKKYVTDDGLNANDKKITNVAKGETATDAARIDQLDKYVEGDSIKIVEDGTDPTTGQTKYKISAVGAGFLEGGDNINVTGGKINLNDNVQLTSAGSIDIGTNTKISDGKVQLVDDSEKSGSELTSKGLQIADRSNPEEQKIAGWEADKFAIAVSKDGGVVQGNGISAKGMEVLDKTEEGKIAGATVNTQVIGIAVSQDNKLSYGAGITAKGIEVADNSGEDENKVSQVTSERVLVAEADKNGDSKKFAAMNSDGITAQSGALLNPDKVVALTTGTSQQGQEYEAGLYIADATKQEHSVLTTSKLTVANKTYIDKNGINANDQKITNVANGSIAQNSKDAVNGGQLWDAYNRMFDMDERINDVYNDVSGVGSQAAALSALQAIPYNPYAPTTVTAGLGFYRSDQAVAVGIYHYIRDSVLVNIGGAFNLNGHGDAMGRAGISFALGKGAGKGGQSIGRDMTEMQKTVAALMEKVDNLEAKDKDNQSKISALEARDKENRETIENLKKELEKKK